MISRLPHYCPVCAYHDWNLDGLVEMTWEYLALIRIYTKPKARPCHCSSRTLACTTALQLAGAPALRPGPMHADRLLLHALRPCSR